MKAKVTGFTLIELVVVITILGILAAFAVPKFIALDTQARVATMNGLAGTVKSAAALARGLSMATNNAAGPVVMEGASVTLSNNYPDSTANGIANAINTSVSGTDFTFTAGNGTTTPAVWTKVGAPAPATCSVTYTPAGVGSTPAVVLVTTGC
jgi:MSHA pilin protein MshA